MLFKDVTHFEVSVSPAQAEVLQIFNSTSSVELIKKELGKARVTRLFRGNSRLRFDEFLTMLDVVFGRVNRLIDLLNLPRKDESNEIVYLKLLANDPVLILIRNVIDLGSYKKLPFHSDEFVAKILGMPLAAVEPRVKMLEECGAIRKQDGLFVQALKPTDTGRNKSSSVGVASFMRQRAIQRVGRNSAPHPKLKQAYLIYASNSKLEEEVFRLARQFYIDVRNLVQNFPNEQTDQVGYFSIDLMQESERED